MALSITKEPKNDLSITNESKVAGASLTVDDATWTVDDSGGTVDIPYLTLTKESKNTAITITNESKN